MKYDDLLIKLHESILTRRKIEYVVKSDKFKEYYNGQTEILQAINKNDLDKLLEILNKPNQKYEEMSIKKLMLIAKSLHIKNYSRLNKINLIRIIKHEKE